MRRGRSIQNVISYHLNCGYFAAGVHTIRIHFARRTLDFFSQKPAHGFDHHQKTHDAAIVLMERIYGEKPRFNYFFGSSQGGREGLTVAQRYPADYDGISSNVPIVSFSSLMLAPELIRIQEKPLANWVTLKNMCSYPAYPKYTEVPVNAATSYVCAAP
jgi:hypothetical protein